MLERGLRVFVGFGKDPGFFFFWEGRMRKGSNKKNGFLEKRKVRIIEVISSAPIFFFPYYVHLIFFFFSACINHLTNNGTD